MDLAKVTPAPWHQDSGMFVSDYAKLVVASTACECYVFAAKPLDDCVAINNAEFIALARNAFDVMMRREWSPFCNDDGSWSVYKSQGIRIVISAPGDVSGQDHPGPLRAADPFTALVKADQWWKENRE